MLQYHPQQFVENLTNLSIQRFHFIYDKKAKKVLASHPALQELADAIMNDSRDFDQHEGLFFQIDPEHKTLQGAFVHRTVRGQAAGGTRYWHYETVEDYLRDGLRLAKGMTQKNALAGIWWGGGKGVIAHNPQIDKQDPKVRQSIYRHYGRLMSAMHGCYVTAEDVGSNVIDMANVFAQTRFTTCIPLEYGGSGNPSTATARGVVCGMIAACEFMQLGTLADKVIGIQGTGNVGVALINFLLEQKVKHIIASDTNAQQVQHLQQKFIGKNLTIRHSENNDYSILATDCDILAPCAIGGVLNPQTIPMIKAKIICGAANNQLQDPMRDDQLLHDQGIIYIPDFLVNRMGIVHCANEQYGRVDNDPEFAKHFNRDWHHSIHQTVWRLLTQAKAAQVPTAILAVKQADELALQPHPIFGHRGQMIIDSLVAARWHEHVAE